MLTTRRSSLWLNVSGCDDIYDESGVAAIERRLAEVRRMARPRRDERHVLERISEEQRRRIEEVANIPYDQLAAKRKAAGARHMIKWVGRMVILLLNGFYNQRRYFQNGRLEFCPNAGKPHHYVNSSLSTRMLLNLTTAPKYRDAKTVKKITWALRAMGAFRHLFPAEMESDVARTVAYECYDDCRVIARQGHVPRRFYYILSGKIDLIRLYSLASGDMTKTMGQLTKGMTTDPVEMEKQCPREDTLVADGNVEVLLLDLDDFKFLQHTTSGPPIEFIRSLTLFEEFSSEVFQLHPECMEYIYYSPGKVVLRDSNRTSWLHIIKSGKVKVVRHQTVIDVSASIDTRFGCSRLENLGCARPFSHAKAMLGIQGNQKKCKAARLVLPGVQQTADQSRRECEGRLKNGKRRQPKTPAFSRSNTCMVDESHRETPPTTVHDQSECSTSLSPSAEHDDVDDNMLRKSNGEEAFPNTQLLLLRHRPSVSLVKVPTRTLSEELVTDAFRPHSLWMTRERTRVADAVVTRRAPPEVAHRDAYLELDVLTTGDVFGVDRMQAALISDPCGVALISDGAEVIKVNKRFFLQNACTNSVLKMETMCKKYISEEEASHVLYRNETWNQYRDAMWQRLLAPYQDGTNVNKSKRRTSPLWQR